MKYTFRKPTIDDAKIILDWRTDPNITKHLYTDIEYDLDAQVAWLERCEGREDYRHFLICSNDRPVGLANISAIDWVNRKCEHGGYIGDLSERTRIGVLWAWYIHDYVFFEMDMNKMVTTVMSRNERIVKGQELNGLTYVGTHRNHIFKNGEYHDVMVFEILKDDWTANPRRHVLSKDETLAAFETW